MFSSFDFGLKVCSEERAYPVLSENKISFESMKFIYRFSSVMMFSEDFVRIFLDMSDEDDLVAVGTTVIYERIDLAYKGREVSEIVV